MDGFILSTVLFVCGLLVGVSGRPLTRSHIASGDLIFVRPALDLKSEFDDAILATGEATVRWLREQGGVPNATRQIASHVAIAFRDEAGNLSFVQALPPAVVSTPEEEFWHTVPVSGTLYLAKASDQEVAGAGAAAATIARQQVGKPYSNAFEPPPDSFYCSSLVEYSYERALSSDGVLCPSDFELIFVPQAFWVQYYAELGLDLPVNVTGSNPTLLLHSPKLTFAELSSPGVRSSR